MRSLFCFFALEKKGGKKTTTVKRLCKDSCFVFLSTPSNSSPCPCLTLHCSCPQNNRQRNFPHSLTHSRLPTSPSSERRTCIYSKPIFPTILTHMHCALDELWLAIITLLSILPVKSVFFFFFAQIPSFVSLRHCCFTELQQRNSGKRARCTASRCKGGAFNIAPLCFSC